MHFFSLALPMLYLGVALGEGEDRLQFDRDNIFH